MVEPLLEVGAIPLLRPARRQIVYTGKSPVCMKCLRIPYPSAPQKAGEHGAMALSSIQRPHPGGWRLLTSLPHPFNKTAAAWSPDGKRIAYSINLFRNDWDIWVMDSDGKNRRPLITGSTIDMAPDWSRDGRAVLFQSNRSGNNDIWMIDIASRKLTQLITNPGQDTMPK